MKDSGYVISVLILRFDCVKMDDDYKGKVLFRYNELVILLNCLKEQADKMSGCLF